MAVSRARSSVCTWSATGQRCASTIQPRQHVCRPARRHLRRATSNSRSRPATGPHKRRKRTPPPRARSSTPDLAPSSRRSLRIMRNIKLILSYDGTDFHGWQSQPGLRTIQQTLEDAILGLTQARPKTTASSRTDAGVHALGQVVHFVTPSRHRPEIILKALNALLPRDLRVLEVRDMPQAFHATLDALSKRYRYVIDDR